MYQTTYPRLATRERPRWQAPGGRSRFVTQAFVYKPLDSITVVFGPSTYRAHHGSRHRTKLDGRRKEICVLIELTDEAQQLVRRKGGTLTVDYIRSTG